MADPETRPMPASLAMVASALFFSLMGVCVKQVGTRIPATEVVLARAVVSVVLSWWMLRRAGIAPWGQRRGLLIWRGAIGTLALLCVYQALALLPLAAATVLQYSYPTFTALLAWLSLGEPVGPRLLGAVALGWMGVMVLAWPPAGAELGTSLPPLAVAIALVGAFSTALAYVSVRALRHSEHPLVIVFYFPLVALVLSLPLVLMNPVVPSWGELVWLLGVGLFTQLGQLTLTAGLMGLPAARATAISYVQVAFAVLWGWLIFAEPLEGTTLVGGLLVLAAALISLKRAGSMAGGSA
jgi:drug/metabolite transporter (DMT)-like permease